ncbi:N-acetylglutamate synthase, GNAT family [Seinonella peptonophila]|uniref:N-acetylglutamate synthase, GNAT family n=1 Tax=Seinonella peptonophila TaxID=112248 RepID=A0A1M4Y4Q7_9BACL|nr:GNAT family N-acetyltransferase [Seinonella peptonophila]SHF00688.1 N-acetylglutamate synthase, GNAT family [Seinonella peptonophila]
MKSLEQRLDQLNKSSRPSNGTIEKEHYRFIEQLSHTQEHEYIAHIIYRGKIIGAITVEIIKDRRCKIKSIYRSTAFQLPQLDSAFAQMMRLGMINMGFDNDPIIDPNFQGDEQILKVLAKNRSLPDGAQIKSGSLISEKREIRFENKKIGSILVEPIDDKTCRVKQFEIIYGRQEAKKRALEIVLLQLGYKQYNIDQDVDLTNLRPNTVYNVPPRSSLSRTDQRFLENLENIPLTELKDKLHITTNQSIRSQEYGIWQPPTRIIRVLNEIYERDHLKKPLIFREARPEDFYEIWELHRQGMNQFRVGVGERDRRRLYADLFNIEKEYGSKGGLFLVAEYRGKVIGTGAFKPVDQFRAELTRFSVAKPYQGSGLGSIILSLVLHSAAEQSMYTIQLRTSEKQRAAHFYQKKEQFFEDEVRAQSPELNFLFKKYGLLPPGKDGIDLISMKKYLREFDFIRYHTDHKIIAEHPSISSFLFPNQEIPLRILQHEFGVKNSRISLKKEREIKQERTRKTNDIIKKLLHGLEKGYEIERRQKKEKLKHKTKPARKKPIPQWTGAHDLFPTAKQTKELKQFTILAAMARGHLETIDLYANRLLQYKPKFRHTHDTQTIIRHRQHRKLYTNSSNQER